MEDKPPFKIVDQDKAEESDVLVCNPASWPSPFKDNKYGTCSECGGKVYFRPHAPSKPRRVCMPCMITLLHSGDVADEAEYTATENSLAEFDKLIKGRMQ